MVLLWKLMEQEVKKPWSQYVLTISTRILTPNTELIVLQKQMESRKDSEITAVYIYGRYWCLVRVFVCVYVPLSSHLLMICWG